VQLALRALVTEQPPFFEYIRESGSLAGSTVSGIHDPSGHARRTVGTWPRPEDRVEQMIAALKEIAEREPDTEKRSRLRKTADYVANMPRDLVVGIVSGIVSASIKP
jgi:hypothetical protein